MKHRSAVSSKKKSITHHLSCLPRRMLQLAGRDNVTEFVLHELAQEDCFNLAKAAYVVDNPDFNCLKGVAGYMRSQAYTPRDTIWQEADGFSSHMKQSSFNTKIRNFVAPSHVKQGVSDKEIVSAIAHKLDFVDPSFYAWTMKHDNHGILLYEKVDRDECSCDYLLEGLCLIGFCPVF